MVSIVPTCDGTAMELFHMTLNVLQIVHNIGLEIVIICTDTNRINVKLYKELKNRYPAFNENGDKFENRIADPFNQDKNIFLFFDSVHIYKNIRNNWLNVDHQSEIFKYPDFITSEVKTADLDIPHRNLMLIG